MATKVRVEIRRFLIKDTSKHALFVVAIKRHDSGTTFGIPSTAQHESFHQELFSIGKVKSGIIGISRERNLNVTLPAEIARLYFDEDGDGVFRDTYLDEVQPVEASKSEGAKLNDSMVKLFEKLASNDAPSTPMKSEGSKLNEAIAKLLEKMSNGDANGELSEKKTDLRDIEKKMSLTSFNGRQNAAEWLKDFEDECERLRVIDSVDKVKCMRLFMSGTGKEWLQATAKKFKETEYDEWKESFKTIFTDRGWANVKYAYSFKYVSGSLVDYALKKESLLLDVEKNMTVNSRICHIIVGLPQKIVEDVDREQMKTTDQLINELRRFETAPGQKKDNHSEHFAKPASSEKNKPGSANANIRKSREPCNMCLAIGKPPLFHSPNSCRSKDQYEKLKDANCTINLGDWTEESKADDASPAGN